MQIRHCSVHGLTKMLQKVCEETEKSDSSIKEKLFKAIPFFLRGTSTK